MWRYRCTKQETKGLRRGVLYMFGVTSFLFLFEPMIFRCLFILRKIAVSSSFFLNDILKYGPKHQDVRSSGVCLFYFLFFCTAVIRRCHGTVRFTQAQTSKINVDEIYLYSPLAALTRNLPSPSPPPSRTKKKRTEK